MTRTMGRAMKAVYFRRNIMEFLEKARAFVDANLKKVVAAIATVAALLGAIAGYLAQIAEQMGN